MHAGLCAALAALLALSPAPAEARGSSTGKAKAAARGAKPPPRGRAPAHGGLERARAHLAAVRRDPAKRRFRHHWERAIRQLTRAARGRDRPVALLEAGRARYALYRFSQVEADRDEALALADRAGRAGSREAAAFAAAVRREAGDDETPRAARPAKRPAAKPAPRPPEPAEEEESDPDLDVALGEAAGRDPPPPAPRPFEARAETGDAEVAPASVSEIRSWSNADYTRVAIYLSRPVPFTQLELPPGDGHPRRLALDLKPAVLERAALAHAVGDAKVERVRTGQNGEQTVRVVLDLHGAESLGVHALDDPARLIVDVGSAAAPADGGAPSRPEGEMGVRRPVRRIIVDAGHGGHDSGAIGPTRVREKDVTLAIARKLARQLEAAGYEVLLTRRDDRYLALEERTAFANAHRGDLFISVHANAHPRRDRRGQETYVLNVADDRYARRLAARENGALRDDAGQEWEVRRIRSDLDAQSSTDASRRLALKVQRELVGGVRARTGEARDLGVKSALFHVLLGARMPAVLVEAAFISNRAEERRLRDPGFQEAVASSIARAVGTFARGEARVAAR